MKKIYSEKLLESSGEILERFSSGKLLENMGDFPKGLYTKEFMKEKKPKKTPNKKKLRNSKKAVGN